MTTQVTAAQIAQLRRMVAEPTSTTYNDTVLTAIIENYPTIDALGQSPVYWSSATPPVSTLNPYWVATYDLNAAAAQIWQEKAAVPAADYDFSVDGGSFDRSQVYEQAMKMARYYGAKRQAGTITLHPFDGTWRRSLWANSPEV
jgi:hypothetical protein